jgi:hypothetical protein
VEEQQQTTLPWLPPAETPPPPL